MTDEYTDEPTDDRADQPPATNGGRPGLSDTSDTEARIIELAVEVDGTPEEVWQAIATSSGISSWYVPHEFDEGEGVGARVVASFGPEPEMQIPGIVAAWEPCRRIVFTGEEPGATLAFEWIVEARDGGSCVVRLVNSGFGDGEDWDNQYDGMREGWQLFLFNLQLHLRHFRGRPGQSALPMAVWPCDQVDAWARLLDAFDLPSSPPIGAVIRAGGSAPDLAGTVVAVDSWRLALLLDEPAPGTAFLAAERYGDQTGVSVWQYLYGEDRASVAATQEAAWHAWLASAAPPG